VVLVLNIVILSTKDDVEIFSKKKELVAEKPNAEFLMRRPDFDTRDVHMGFLNNKTHWMH